MEAGPRTKPLFVVDRLYLIIASALLGAAALSWAATYFLMPTMMMPGTMGLASLVSSLALPVVATFELVWVIGMAAMMFPAMIPVVAFYNRFVAKEENNPTAIKLIGTPLFLFGYLIAYAALGLGAYFAVFAGLSLAAALPLPAVLAIVAPSAVLVVAGLYQLTGLKVKMLSNCVSPVGFFATRLHRGLLGSIRMGLSHGTYCATCCWAYMLVMLSVAWMSLPFMAAVSGVIVLEKVVVRGSKIFTKAVGAGFFVLALLVLVFPGLLTFQMS